MILTANNFFFWYLWKNNYNKINKSISDQDGPHGLLNYVICNKLLSYNSLPFDVGKKLLTAEHSTCMVPLYMGAGSFNLRTFLNSILIESNHFMESRYDV